MAAPAPFSRLQLAAALLEYDNDPDNPDAPYRSAQESAIFLPLRRLAASRPLRKSDYLSVALPSESGAHGARESMVDNRRSRASRSSFDALRNPFGLDDTIVSEDEEGHEMEVDLTSWGLDAFMAKDKEAKHGKGKAKASTSESIQPMSSVRSHKPLTNNDTDAPRRVLGSRSMSVGNIDLQVMNSDQGPSNQMDRRRSFGSPLDLAGVVPSEDLSRRQFASDALPPEEPQSIPFPSTSVRSPSPANGGRMSMQQEEDNPFAVRPPSRGSRFDPKSMLHARTMSNASMGSRMLLENDGNSVMTGPAPTTRDPRYSTTLDLLRPKVLVMPSPLQPASQPTPEPQANVREGFQFSTDGPPLPPGARTGRRVSNNLMDGLTAPSASNLFTPNPSMNLSLSQMTFRNTLAVGGQASSSNLPKAMLDGEQIRLEDDDPDPAADAHAPPLLDESGRAIRPAGKLYGKSLIDDLEARKANMRSKQRVFTGDQRPSMMARSSTAPRASTFIDPATLQARPTSSFGIPDSQPGPGLTRRNSTLKPLLNFENDGPVNTQGMTRPPQSRSVFGVDHIWESEMAKLKELEAQEKLEEERQRLEEEADAKKSKKRKGKSKKGVAPEVPSSVGDAVIDTPEADSRVSAEPPILPQIPKAVRRLPPVIDDGEESESDDDEPAPIANKELNNWHDSSDEEREPSGPQRITGTGLRYPKSGAQRRQPLPEDSDDEDVPLSVAAQRTMQRHLHPQNDDSDEEKPLFALLEKTKLNIPPVNFGGPVSANRSDDEDDQPLGLRASKFIPQLGGGEDDDDRPLALHPDQQLRTQYQMMAQQQQMMMQAQFQNSMFFPPPNMMAPGFFAAPMMPQMMMQPPMPIPSPPPMHDEAKFGRVDKWRRDVAVDSDP